MRYDVIVLGIGGMGSAAAFELARRGRRVLGLEQFDIGHNLGSSHGVNRIIRLAYAESPDYVPLVRRAYELWRGIENRTGERLLFITGGIDAGPEQGEIVQGSLAACKAYTLPHENLSPAELHRRFPGFRLPNGMSAVYQPDAGFVLCERAIITYVMAAQTLGAEIHARERVRRWDVRRGTVTVFTDKGRYVSDRLVITAGPWTASLVSTIRERQLLAPERQVLIWTQPIRPDLFRLGAFPVFNMEAVEQGENNRYYGFPVYAFPGFKIGKYHHLHEEVDPDNMKRSCTNRDESVLRKAIRRYFPDANGPVMAMTTCIFTNSPDEHFILDKHPEFPNVSIAAGFSGHGFKFCSVVGEVMAALALDDSYDRCDLSLFRISRPRISRAGNERKKS